MQVTVFAGTPPLLVGGEKVQDTVSTAVPAGCCTTMTAEVNPRSVIDSVQFVFGQSGAPAIVELGA